MKRSSHDRLGTRIAGTYRLDRVIGRGGMGVVYAGQHVRTSRPVAVKILATQSEDARKRFLREATIVGKTDHPNVVGVIDVGEEEDALYIVLELLHGEPLSRYLARHRRLTPIEALDVALPIVDALACLHEAGVVHRDIKPANVFLAIDGVGSVVPTLLDFGISRAIEHSETSLTASGALLGTPEYMSPEQVRGENDVGPSSDVWALGVVLYECLSGKKPFAAPTVGGVIARIVSESPTPLSRRAPDVPSELAAEIDRALARDPDERHASMRELGDALAHAASGAGLDVMRRASARIEIESSAGETPTIDAGMAPMQSTARRRVAVALAALAFAAAGVGAIIVVSSMRTTSPRRVVPIVRIAEAPREDAGTREVAVPQPSIVEPVEVPIPARPRRPRRPRISSGSNGALIIPNR
jgi:serine/threonine-protein kinase